MSVQPDSVSHRVATHYDGLDPFYRRMWGLHVHHGLWDDPAWTPETAVVHLVHRVAADAGMQAGTRVCDVGSGYGAPAKLWAETYGAEVTAFTLSPAQHAIAQRQPVRGPRPDYRLQDWATNGLPAASQDAAVFVESLTHMPDPEAALQEAGRVVRPGGRLVACVWAAADDPPAWMREWLLAPIVQEGRLSGLPTFGTLRRWTTEAGFRVVRMTDVSDRVARTWTVVIQRFFRALVTDPSVLAYLLNPDSADRTFALTVLRLWLAFRTGAMRYAWVVGERAVHRV